MRAYLDGRTMDDVAMERLRKFEPDALDLHPSGYWLGFSTGKDSVVIENLARRAGVKYESHFSYSAEAPESIAFCRKYYPEVSIDMPEKSLWKLIETNGPPTRQHRWCCRQLKERGGIGRVIVDGVRRAESNNRAKRLVFEAARKGPIRWMLHPIVDWSTEAVWEYIKKHDLPINPLYSEGFTRVGCVMCPNANRHRYDMERWPRIAEAYRKAIAKRWKTSAAAKCRFVSADDMWEWWISGKASGPKLDDCGLFLFEDNPEIDSPLFEEVEA